MLHGLREADAGLAESAAIPRERGWIVKQPAEFRVMPTKVGATRTSRNAPNPQRTETIQRTVSLVVNVLS